VPCLQNQTWTVEMQQISCFKIKRKTVINKFRLFYHYLKSGHRVPSCNFYTNKPCRVKSCKRFHHRLLHPRAKSTVFYEELKAKVIEGPIVRKVNYVDGRVEVRSDQVYFELVNLNNKLSEQFSLGLLKT